MGKGNASLGTPSSEYKGAGALYVVDASGNEILFGATKGGGTFNDGIEKRMREADGDFFDVKGAIDITKIKPTLTFGALSLTTANMLKLASGLAAQTAAAGSQDLIQTLDLTYFDKLRWYAKNRAGYEICIELQNVINVNPFSFNFVKDDEIVINPLFQATVDPATFDIDDVTTYPYKITVAASTVTFTISDASGIVEGALVTFEGEAKLSAAVTGTAVFTTQWGTGLKYTVSKTGYTTKTGVATVDADTEAVAVLIVAAG